MSSRQLMNCVVFRFCSVLWLVCGWWPLAPSLPHSLPPSLCARTVCTESLACSRNCDLCLSLSPPERCARNRSLAHVIATFVLSLSCLALSVIEVVVVVVHNRSTYLSFLSQQSTYEIPLPPLSFLPAPSVLFLCILRRRKTKLLLCALLVVVCARVVAVAHVGDWDFKAESVVERERERASEPSALSAFVCALSVKFFTN
jgi:hypothetical protein